LTSGKAMAEVAAGNNIAPSLVTEWKEAFIKGEDSKELKKAQKKLEEKDKTIETLMKKITIGKEPMQHSWNIHIYLLLQCES